MKTMRDYAELRNSLSDVAKAESILAKHEIILDMELQQFRKEIVGLTQIKLAKHLTVSQAEVSKLEKRRDMLISTLQAYCSALGAELHIVMEYGGTKVRLMLPESISNEVFVEERNAVS